MPFASWRKSWPTSNHHHQPDHAMSTTTQTTPHQPTCLEPAHWSKDEHRKIDEISEALSTLPDSVLASIETAFRILESGSTLKPESLLWREAQKMILSAQVARCL